MGNGCVNCDGHVMERIDEIVEESVKWVSQALPAC